MKPFGYLHDRLFLCSLPAYAVNRLIILPRFSGLLHTRLPSVWSFLHSHLDDLLLMPVALPVILWVQRLTGLRTRDGTPTWSEMFTHLAIWAFMAKIVGPYYCHVGVADPWDLLYFTAGGIGACAWWNRRAQPVATAAENGNEL